MIYVFNPIIIIIGVEFELTYTIKCLDFDTTGPTPIFKN